MYVDDFDSTVTALKVKLFSTATLLIYEIDIVTTNLLKPHLVYPKLRTFEPVVAIL